MRLAYRTRPGIPGPSRKAAIGAVCLAAGAGFYGFTTSVQKTATLRGPGGAVAAAPDDSRLAVGVAATPSLVYAVTDRPTGQLAVAAAVPAAAPRDTIVETPVATDEIALISQPVTEPVAETLAVPTAPLAVPAAPVASDQALPAIAVIEAQPNATTPVIPTP